MSVPPNSSIERMSPGKPGDVLSGQTLAADDAAPIKTLSVPKKIPTYQPPVGVSAPAPTSSSWKDHPLVVASIAVAATIGLAVLLFKEVILPTHSVSLSNQITSLTNELQILRKKSEADVQSIGDLSAKLEAANRRAENLEQSLTKARISNLFSSGNPYPIGLGRIQVGQSIEQVTLAYPTASIKKSDGYWSVENQHPFFESIVYYYDEEEKSKIVTHISFRRLFRSKVGDSFLQEKLTEALGPPKSWSRTNFYSWQMSKLTVYMSDPTSMILMPAG